MYMSDRATDIGNLKPGNKNKAGNLYGGGNTLGTDYRWNKNPTTNPAPPPQITNQPVQQQPSYNPYSDYVSAMERIQRAQMEQMERLRQEQQRARDAAYQTASEQQKKDYEYSQGQLNDTTGRALQEAYINKILTLKNLPQQLTAQGLNGGASETTLGSMNNNYANARNSLENERHTQLAALLNTYQNNMAQLEAQRASGEAASISQFAPQLLGLTANNGVDLINLIQGTGLATATPSYSRRRLNEEEYY